MCDSGKCLFGEMSFVELSMREMSIWGIFHSVNCPSENYPSQKCPWGIVCQRKCCWIKVQQEVGFHHIFVLFQDLCGM